MSQFLLTFERVAELIIKNGFWPGVVVTVKHLLLLTGFGSEVDAERRDGVFGRVSVQLRHQQIVVLHPQRKLLNVWQTTTQKNSEEANQKVENITEDIKLKKENQSSQKYLRQHL